jgi:predicted AlkP superfamily pyrophosphatase or phosphodiesterase
MRKFVSFVLAALVPAAASGQAPAQTPAPAVPPKLLIVVSVDQFSADLWDQYRPQFTGGLARLASGTVFRNGYQSHAATETCPGHSTLLTGDHPATTGIIANSWVNQALPRSDKTIYCAEDESAPGTSSIAYKVSPLHLRVPTLGELMKRQWPASRNVAVSGKDRAAIMMGGHQVDQRWYWDGKKFATDLGLAELPAVTRANTAVATALATAEPPLETTPFCAGRAQPFALPGGLVVGNGALTRAAGDVTGFRASPQFDGFVLALSAALVQDMKLGSAPTPDLLSISLSATDYVGHGFGPGGQEMCLQLLSLDRSLGDFFRFMDSTGVDYAVILTADHGGLDIPERLRANGVTDAVRVDPNLTATNMGKAIAAKLKLGGPVLIGDVAGDVYIDHGLRPGDRASVLREALDMYRAHPQVQAAYSRDQIARTAMPGGDPTRWSLLERARASYDPERSGDILVMLKPHVMPIAAPKAGYVATHGSPWDYDRRVPILFWRRGMAPANLQQPAETVDILPTAAAMLGLPGGVGKIDGHCLATVTKCPSGATVGTERGQR